MNTYSVKKIILIERGGQSESARCDMLEKSGFSVICEDNPDRAFETAEKDHDIRLLLVDDDSFPDIRLSDKKFPVPFLYIISDEKFGDNPAELPGHHNYISKSSCAPVLISSVKTAIDLAEARELSWRRAGDTATDPDSDITVEDLFNGIPSGIYIYQFKKPDRLYMLTGNAEAGKITGIYADRNAGREFSEIWPFEGEYGIKRRYLDVAINGGCTEFTEEFYTDNRISGTYRVKVFAMRGERLGVAFENITKIKEAEKALRESEAHYHLLADNMADAVWLMDMNLMTIYHTPSSERLRGFTVEEIMQIPPEKQITTDSFDRAIPIFIDEMQRAESDPLYTFTRSIELEFIRKDGTTLWTDCTFSLIRDGEGKPAGMLGAARDITARRDAEQRVNNLLKEKELLLKEIHHRIKNNMQTVASLLLLQADSVTERSAAEALTDASNRVMSMMLIYNRLYRSPDFNEMSTCEYLPALIESIFMSVNYSSGIRISHSIEDFTLKTSLLFPVGIIINELLTNSIKHAFIGRTEGLISISLKRVNGAMEILIIDNGTGFSPQQQIQESQGFGLNLVNILVTQLKGELALDSSSGTRYSIIIPC